MFSSKAHGLMDYATALVLFLSPFLFGFVSVDPARNVFVTTAVVVLFYALITNHPAALLRVVPVGVHSALDLGSGLFLIVAPFVFGYRSALTPAQMNLHYAVASTLFVIVAVTRKSTATARHARRSRDRHLESHPA